MTDVAEKLNAPLLCVKCGSKGFKGPRYSSGAGFSNLLVYTCRCCGYEVDRKCLDALP